MSPISATTAALAGIQANFQLLDQSAAQIANPEASAHLAQAMVNLKIAEQGVAVNAEVLRAMDETLGSIIDILA